MTDTLELNVHDEPTGDPVGHFREMCRRGRDGYQHGYTTAALLALGRAIEVADRWGSRRSWAYRSATSATTTDTSSTSARSATPRRSRDRIGARSALTSARRNATTEAIHTGGGTDGAAEPQNRVTRHVSGRSGEPDESLGGTIDGRESA